MTTYKIRTHNPLFGATALVLMTVVLSICYVFLNGETLMNRLLLFMTVTNISGRVLFAFLTLCFYSVSYYYFFTTVTTIIVSEEGINAIWRDDFPGNKKIEKTINWLDVLSFTINTARNTNILIINTSDGNEYRLYFYSGFITTTSESFYLFVNDLKSRIKEVPYSIL